MNGLLTDFFLLPVMVVRILEKGRDTLLKRGFKVNVTKVNPMPPSFLPPSFKINNTPNLLGLREFLELSNFCERALRSQPLFPSHCRYSRLPGISRRSIVSTHLKVGRIVVMIRRKCRHDHYLLQVSTLIHIQPLNFATSP